MSQPLYHKGLLWTKWLFGSTASLLYIYLAGSLYSRTGRQFPLWVDVVLALAFLVITTWLVRGLTLPRLVFWKTLCCAALAWVLLNGWTGLRSSAPSGLALLSLLPSRLLESWTLYVAASITRAQILDAANRLAKQSLGLTFQELME